MVIAFSRNNAALIIVIAAVATLLSVISYEYSTYNANEIFKIASDDVRSNADIQSSDLANILVNKIESVRTNLEIMADSTAIQNQDVQSAIPLFASARKSTSDFVSSYFWVGQNGKLLWADAFTNKTVEQQYNGEDRSFREYYSDPRDTLAPYYSTVVESVDGIPRMYISYPILAQGSPTAEGFKGVVVAAVDLDVLGKFLQSQLSPKYQTTTGLIDRNGMILYSSNATYIGKDVFGPEFQSVLPAQIKDSFNSFLRESLRGRPGSGDISYQGDTSTIAYQPVSIRGNDFAILYVVAPHQLADNVSFLIDQQRAFNTIMIIVIGAVATGIAILVLVWNKRLAETVSVKTSELKTANESLVESNTQLARVNEQLQVNDKMQREFINIAAHELRTPTQAILGYSELFDMNPEGREESMKAVARNALRLERLTNDILDVTRIEGNALNLNKENFNVREVISNAVEDTKSRLVNGGSIKFLFDDSEDVYVQADRARINQVVSNLLSNAAKFTQKGMVSVTLEKAKDGREVIISVKDTGAGIHPDIVPRLFTKFTSKSQTGTGLGLFISKSIVEAHGGRIWGENNKGGEKGATFTFTLPLSSKDEGKRE